MTSTLANIRELAKKMRLCTTRDGYQTLLSAHPESRVKEAWELLTEDVKARLKALEQAPELLDAVAWSKKLLSSTEPADVMDEIASAHGDDGWAAVWKAVPKEWRPNLKEAIAAPDAVPNLYAWKDKFMLCNNRQQLTECKESFIRRFGDPRAKQFWNRDLTEDERNYLRQIAAVDAPAQPEQAAPSEQPEQPAQSEQPEQWDWPEGTAILYRKYPGAEPRYGVTASTATPAGKVRVIWDDGGKKVSVLTSKLEVAPDAPVTPAPMTADDDDLTPEGIANLSLDTSKLVGMASGRNGNGSSNGSRPPEDDPDAPEDDETVRLKMHEIIDELIALDPEDEAYESHIVRLFQQRLDAICYVRDRLKAEEKGQKAKFDALVKEFETPLVRVRSAINRIDRYALWLFEQGKLGIRNEGRDRVLSFHKTEAVEVLAEPEDVRRVAPDAVEEVVTLKVKKSALKQLIKDGHDIDGVAELKENLHPRTGWKVKR
ncbi:hypothetical protein [Lyngbya sp. CCY1209]|uniref:hypothetical protein n=1 Tax=Lyngbya sp. CCY1209 TaxID=2886103 RepID=UPI002D214483|nr:hypothetical protein [Lyngbya sp. CCY1209]MEB3884025.1 siphovirus Gp157 family protein [Lyngbya sp. CCY1209]